MKMCRKAFTIVYLFGNITQTSLSSANMTRIHEELGGRKVEAKILNLQIESELAYKLVPKKMKATSLGN